MGACAGAWLGDDEGSVIGAGAWLGKPPVLSLLTLSSLFLLSPLSLFFFESWNSFKGKIETEIHFWLGRVILWSTRKLISV